MRIRSAVTGATLAAALVAPASAGAQAPATPTVRSSAGSLADAQAAANQFRADLGGGVTAGANGSFGGVRREINWDGTPTSKSSPNTLPPDFFNTTSPRGAVFSTPGGAFQVSGAAAHVRAAAVRFGNFNPNYPATFQAFSPEKLFTPTGSNVTTVTFFVPGTTTRATVRGFGAVFSDVDTAGSTKVELLDKEGQVIFTRDVPATAG